jgi:hypothetical protein
VEELEENITEKRKEESDSRDFDGSEIDEEREESIRSLIPDLTYQKKSGLGTAISKIYFTDQKFAISGFLEASSITTRGEKNREGEIELYYSNLYRSGTYIGYKILDNLIFNSELQVEYLTDGTKEDGYELNVEAIVDYLIHPSFNIRVGNLPMPIGYVNINEEPVMYHSVSRPDVERIIIPTQWLEFGGMIFGSLVAGFDYNIAVLQGLNASEFREGSWIRSGRSFKYNGFQDTAYLFKVEWNGLDDFTLGAGYYFGNSGAGERTAMGEKVRAEVSLGILNLFYKYEIFQLTGVLVGGRVTDTEKIFELSGNIIGERVYGGYLDFGVDILPFLRSKGDFYGSTYGIILFGRYERLDTHDKVRPELADLDRSQKDLTIWTFGLNYKPTKEMVFKINYQKRTNHYKFDQNDFREDPDRVEFGFGLIY